MHLQRLRIEGVDVDQLFKELGLLDDAEIDAVSVAAMLTLTWCGVMCKERSSFARDLHVCMFIHICFM
jgi:hypothetical protein